MSIERITAACTSIGWIPSEAMSGLMRVPLDLKIGHYDAPPPDRIDDVEAFVAAGRCRFANRLEAWADVREGRIVAAGCDGGGLVASTDLSVGPLEASIPAIAFPDLRTTETDGNHAVTFVQTAGARTGAPFPRRVAAGGLRLMAPTAWSTVAVTLRADGATSFEARGASRFPRHWFYDADGRLTAKSATIDYRNWTSTLHDDDTPWGEAQGSIKLAVCETALERELSRLVMQAHRRPRIRRLAPGEALMTAGEPSTTMMVVLDGLLAIDFEGHVVAECGPGSVLGERATLEAGVRTSTVSAVTAVKVAEFAPDALDRNDLVELGKSHRRELDEHTA